MTTLPVPELADVSRFKDTYRCRHCKQLLQDAVQTIASGDRICHICFKEIEIMPNGICTDCGVVVGTEKFHYDKAVQREINLLIVVCPYRQLECTWEDTLKKYKSHVTTCEFKGERCPHEGCSQIVPTNKLQQHAQGCDYRIMECDLCNQQIVARESKAHKDTECAMTPAVCSWCKNTISQRKQLTYHQNDSCEFEKCLVCNDIVYRNTSIKTKSDDAEKAEPSPKENQTKNDGAKKAKPSPGKKKSKNTDAKKAEPSPGKKQSKDDDPTSLKEDEYHLKNPLETFKHVQVLARRLEGLKNPKCTSAVVNPPPTRYTKRSQ